MVLRASKQEIRAIAKKLRRLDFVQARQRMGDQLQALAPHKVPAAHRAVKHAAARHARQVAREQAKAERQVKVQPAAP